MHDRQEKVYRIHFSSSSCWPSSVLPFSLPFFPSSSSFPSRDPYLPPVTPDDGMQTQTPSECACEAIMIFDLHRDFDCRRAGGAGGCFRSLLLLLLFFSRLLACQQNTLYTREEKQQVVVREDALLLLLLLLLLFLHANHAPESLLIMGS